MEGDWWARLAVGSAVVAGCYCVVNHILRDIIDRLGAAYAYVVIDNEAGLEHLSRRTTRDVDVLYVVTDPTVRGTIAAGRVADLREELDVNIKNAYLVVNRLVGELSPTLVETIAGLGIPLAGTIPADAQVSRADADGRPLVELGPDSAIYGAVQRIVEKTLLEKMLIG